MSTTRSQSQPKLGFTSTKLAHTSIATKKSTSARSKHGKSIDTASTKEKEKDDIPQGATENSMKSLNWNAYNKYYASLSSKRGISSSIHTEGQKKVHEILRIFDLSYEYGPCIGVTRLERWERARKLGLSPPAEIKAILQTQEGSSDPDLAENIFHAGQM